MKLLRQDKVGGHKYRLVEIEKAVIVDACNAVYSEYPYFAIQIKKVFGWSTLRSFDKPNFTPKQLCGLRLHAMNQYNSMINGRL